jgi:hypothetical protein
MLSAVRRTLPTPSACSPATPGSTSALSRASSSSHSTGSSRRHSRIWGSDRAGSEGIAPRNSSCRMCPGCQQRTKLGQLLRSHLGQSGRLLALPSPTTSSHAVRSIVLEQRIVRAFRFFENRSSSEGVLTTCQRPNSRCRSRPRIGSPSPLPLA